MEGSPEETELDKVAFSGWNGWNELNGWMELLGDIEWMSGCVC